MNVSSQSEMSDQMAADSRTVSTSFSAVWVLGHHGPRLTPSLPTT